MANLTTTELNALRELIMGHQTMIGKFNDYATQCQDPQIKQMFQKASTDALNGVQQLLGQLN